MSDNKDELAAKNREYFDKMASEYDHKPGAKDLVERTTNFVQERIEALGIKYLTSQDHQVRLLDYACGTGMVTRALGPFINESVGIDVSEGMVDRFNKLSSAGLAGGAKAQAHVGNLLSSTPPSEFSSARYQNFDIAAIGLGFHHFSDHAAALRTLAERLRGGGVLVIIDFQDDGTDLPGTTKEVVRISGFSEGLIKSMFEEAGLRFKTYQLMEGPIRLGSMNSDHGEIVKTIFAASAIKP